MADNSKIQFFLDADGGSLAFLKEADQPDYSSSLTRSFAADGPDSIPTEDVAFDPPPSPGDELDCSEIRSVMCHIQYEEMNSPDTGSNGDPGYEFLLMGYSSSSSSIDGHSMNTFAEIPDYSIVARNAGDVMFKADVQAFDGVYPVFPIAVGCTVYVEVAPIPFG